MLTLAQRSLGRVAWPCAGIAALLGAFQFALIAAAVSLVEQGTFGRLDQVVPGFVRDVLGSALTSFPGMVTLGYFEPVPVLMIVLFAVYVATEPAGDVESGLVDLLLARPLPRVSLVTRTVAAVILSTVAIVAGMTVALWMGLWWLAPPGEPWPAPRLVGLLAAYLLAVTWCFGALALAASAWARRRSAALLPVSIGAVAMYLLDMLGDRWKPASAIATVSPFHYFPGASVLDGHASPFVDFSVFAVAIAFGLGAACCQFTRRDL